MPLKQLKLINIIVYLELISLCMAMWKGPIDPKRKMAFPLETYRSMGRIVLQHQYFNYSKEEKVVAVAVLVDEEKNVIAFLLWRAFVREVSF